ncbi:MAG TPA: hypothetical protein VHK86_07455 [Nitrososphaera sp.]|nr:hypothetical protein [Nitrososphaera sp.]
MFVPWFERKIVQPSSSSSGFILGRADATMSGLSPLTPKNTGSGP